MDNSCNLFRNFIQTRHIPAGEHVVHARVFAGSPPMEDLHHAALEGFEVLSSMSANVFVKQFRSFPATFEWQKVHPWQRLPSGLDIQMDMATPPFSKGVQARIPDPWPLLMPVRSSLWPKYALHLLKTKLVNSISRGTVLIFKHCSTRYRMDAWNNACF